MQTEHVTVKEQQRRERIREYEAALSTAASALAVLALFVQARESRAHAESLEEAFAATSPAQDTAPLPAAVWVALRQNDIDAALSLLISLSHADFVIAAHEEVDEGYRLVTVEENRALPELDVLSAQLSESLHVPVDVLAMVAAWGADDPRTEAEIDSLMQQRFGPPAVPVPPLPRRASAAAPARSAPAGAHGGLTMSAGEFSALLSMSPEQRRVLATLIRQTMITIHAND